jgi:hypothetical protein
MDARGWRVTIAHQHFCRRHSRETSRREFSARNRVLILLSAGVPIIAALATMLIWFRQADLSPFSANVKEAASFTNFDSIPLPPFAKVLSDETVSVEAKRASGSNIFIPRRGTLRLDYEVESGKKMMVTLVTGEQYQQLSVGRTPSGQPPLKVIVERTGRRSPPRHLFS